MGSKWTKIEPFSWPPRSSVIRLLPREPGCYAIYLNGEVGYIGQTTNLQQRLTSYRLRWAYSNDIFTPWGQFSSVEIKYRKSLRYGDWAMAEARLIKRLQPPFNRTGSIRKRGAAA